MSNQSITDVYILNRSTLVSDQAARRAVEAVAIQVVRDFAPVWFISARIIFAPKGHKVPPGNRVIVIVDNATEWDGMHTLSKGDKPYGIVAVQPEIDSGTNWTVCLSHEVLEMLADSFLGLLVLRDRRAYAVEVCDACEGDQYGYRIRLVLVSDFVTPRWYDLTDSGPYSFRGNCKRPFHILHDGYIESRYFPKANAKAIRQHTGRELPASKITTGSRKSRRK